MISVLTESQTHKKAISVLGLFDNMTSFPWKEFIEKHEGGENRESATIYSIVNTMTQLTEVNGIKILIDGKEDQQFKDGKIKFNDTFVKLDN